MASYTAPLRDMRFVLHELLGAEERLTTLPGYEEATTELIDAALDGVAKLCEEVLQPINRGGDEHGCRFENGVVRTPPGFKAAYEAFTGDGWTALACDPAYGGQGLPRTINFFVDEMVASANMAFGLYLILTYGAYRALEQHASDDLKARFLPHLASGEWTGTMCLTEPHCGTDLGLCRTRAVDGGDGSYRINGTKIFITGGEQDLTANIVHLVLARTPDAPPGVKGLSMFVVPKYVVGADGRPGARNGVFCGSIEDKMGIHGASTCVLNFEDAEGYLVGEVGRGMHTMFTMMNHERLVVGVQGLAQAETAYQNALAYARERRQGVAPGGRDSPGGADAIIAHPDVRRMLLTAKAYNEGARALSGWLALQIDVAERHPDAAVRVQAEDLVGLLTPVVKGFFTDAGSEVCNLCLQVFGGHGYIREWGMEQLVRDVRITQIYEGTNGVQALDLVGRKLTAHEGRAVRHFFGLIDVFVEAERDTPAMGEFVRPLAGALLKLRETTARLTARMAADAAETGAASSDYLRFMALVSLAYMWAMMAGVALSREHDDDTGFYRAKLATARFFMARLLPQINALQAAVDAGSESLMALGADEF